MLPYCSFLPPCCQTFSQREKRQQLQERRKAVMDARLARVRQRKMEKQFKEGGGADVSSVAVNLTDFGEKDEKNEGTAYVYYSSMQCGLPLIRPPLGPVRVSCN